MNKDILAAVCESPLKFDHFEIIKRIKSKWSAHVWTEQNLVFKNVLEMLSLKCWQSGVPHFKGILVTLPYGMVKIFTKNGSRGFTRFLRREKRRMIDTSIIFRKHLRFCLQLSQTSRNFGDFVKESVILTSLNDSVNDNFRYFLRTVILDNWVCLDMMPSVLYCLELKLKCKRYYLHLNYI